MKSKLSLPLFGAIALLLFARAVPGLDGVVIAHEGVGTAKLTPAGLKDVLTGKTGFWEGGQAVTVVFVVDKTDAALKEATGMDSGAFKTFWQRLVFSGRGQQPKRVDDGAAAVALVSATKGAVAIVPAGTVAKGVKVLEIQ